MESSNNNDIIHPDQLELIWKNMKGVQNVVGFYSHKSSSPHPSFSNFYNHKPFCFTIPEWCGIMANIHVDIDFSEKAIMLCKASLMGDQETFNKILSAKTPADAKKLGRKISPFDDNLWKNNVCQIAKTIVTCKFASVQGLADELLSTGDALIAEATTNDKFWGIGLNTQDPDVAYPEKWQGNNILGWALMEARKNLNQNLA